MQVEGYSLDAQKERLTKFAEYQGMEIVREYCDAGKSGKSIAGRPEFQQMLQDVADERDGVDYILVFKLSRFGRNAADVLNSLQYIQDFGVNLICVEDGIDSSKDSGKLTITVLSAVAEIERENILVQTMEGRRQKAREGKWNGGQAPFGYTLDSKNSTLLINTEEAEIIRLIYDKYINTDMGASRIADYLNSHGYTKKQTRSHENTYFAASFVKKVLENPVYAGKIVYGKSVTERVKGTRDQYRRIKADDYLIYDGNHKAIISEAEWDAASAKRSAKALKWNKDHTVEHVHLLSGIIKCPICGEGISGTVRRRKNKKTGDYKIDYYYRCHRRSSVDGELCPFNLLLNQEELDQEVVSIISNMTKDNDFQGYIMKRLEDKVDVSELEKEREQHRAQLRQVLGAKNKLTQMLDRLDINDKHYDRKYQDMQERLDNLYDNISELEDEIAEVDGKINAAYGEHISAQEVFKVLSDFDKLYKSMSDLEKREFMQSFIKSIELNEERDENGRILSKIELLFTLYYDGLQVNEIRLPKQTTVEAAALLTAEKEET